MHCYECENETMEPDIIQHNNTNKQRIVKTHRLKDSKRSLPTEKVVVGGCGGWWWVVVGGGGGGGGWWVVVDDGGGWVVVGGGGWWHEIV